MAETISTLLYGSAIDISGLEKSAREARAQLQDIGDFATKTFDQSISRTLANSVQPAQLSAGVARAKAILGSLGIDVSKTFERTLGRNLARQTLKPFVEESSTFLGQLKQGFTSTLGVGRVALGVGLGGILADVVRGLASAAKEAINLAAQFELGLAKVQTIADRGFNVDQVGKQLLELSTRIPQTATSLAEGLFGIIGSGIKETSDALSVLETSARAAVAGVSTTEAAAKSIVFVLNAFGKSAEEAAHVSDILFKTVDEGVIEFNDLAANIGDVVGPAALAGASLEDVSAAIATMTKAGISAAETTTAVRRLLGEIVSPADKAAAAAKQLGIDLSQAGIKAAGGFGKFIQQIAEITKGDITKLREIFPEERAFRAIAILAGTMTDEFGRLTTQFNDLNQVAGATDRAFGIINETAAFQFKLFKNNLAAAVTEVGQSLLEDLLPVLVDINDLFADTTPIEKTIRALQELGIAGEELRTLQDIAAFERTQKQIGELRKEIDELGESAEFVGGARLFTTESLLGKLFAGGEESVGEIVKSTRELLEVEDGIKKVNDEIEKSKNRIRELSAEIARAELGGDQDRVEELVKSQKIESSRIEIMAKILALNQAITEQERKANEERFKALGIIRAGGAAGPPVPVDQQKKFTEESKLSAEQQAEIAKHAEAAAKFIEDAARKMELLAAADDPERRLIVIRQEADERRKALEGQVKAIETVGRLQQAEQARVIKDFGDKLRKEVEQRIEKIIKLDIEPKLITKAKLPEIDLSDFGTFTKKQAKKIREDIDDALSTALVLDELKTKTFSQRISKTLNEALVESPASILLNKISDVGALIDEELINFAGTIDRGFGDLLAGVANFAANISSGNILGAITGAIGTIGKIFGGDSERKRAEAERRQQIAAEESARAAEKAAQALEDLRRAAEEFGAGKLTEDLDKLVNEFELITNASRDLTSAEVDRAAALIEEAVAVGDFIPIIEQLIAQETDPERFAELLNQLTELRQRQSVASLALQELGIDLGNVTAAELERIKALLEEKGIFDEAIARFQAFGDGFSGFMDKLQLGFDLLDVTDPAAKLEALLSGITTTFGFKIPERFKTLNEFMLAAFEEMKKGGQALIDFLIEAGLEEFVAKEFADLLRTLNEFSQGVDTTGDSIADAFGDLLDKLQLEFQLLDIEDPIKQLRRLREEVARQFGAVVPETLEGIDDLIKSGLQALLAGGDALDAFLRSINLEELIGKSTEEQFRAFLEALEGLGDEAARQIEEATTAAEEITTSQVKSITFQQANKLIDEVTTIRIVVTQMLDQMRLGALANLPNIDLNNLAAALSGLNAGARSNYFIVRNGGIEKVSENQLSDIDRRLIEQARAAAQARGIN